MLPYRFNEPPEEELDEESFAKDIDTKIRELNAMFELATKLDIAVQVTMITREKVPAMRLDGVYKRLDKPLILRV